MKTIKIGRNYQHSVYGGVTVDKLEPTTDVNMPIIVHFTTRSGSGIKESQGINGFNFGIGITRDPWPVDNSALPRSARAPEL